MILLTALARSFVVALVALALWLACRRQSAALRHWVLAAAIGATALVVPLSLALPAWSPFPQQIEQVVPRVSEAIATRIGTPVADDTAAADVLGMRPSLTAVLIATWLAGAFAGLTLLLARLACLVHLSANAEPITDGRWQSLAEELAFRLRISTAIDLRLTAVPGIVATFGVRRPRVLVPLHATGWDDSWIRVVLGHELAHVARRDWAFQMGAEAVRALLWPNVALWMLCAALRRESECACDDQVVTQGIEPATYARHLVDIARACRNTSFALPALPAVGPSTLERRITMLLKSNRDRRLPSAAAVACIVLGMLALGTVVASVSLSAQANAPQSTGALSGYVYDPSGAVLPAVEVVLEDERQVKWPAMTDSTGRFEFTPVGAGKYVLRATLAGFRTLGDSFELRNTNDWTRSVTLQVGELEETITVTEKRPAPKPAVTTAAQPVRIGGNIKPPVKLVNVPPVYPASMRDAGLEGTVPMEAVIAADGSVASVRVVSAQVHPALARAAEDAVRQWRFSQTLLNGVAVEVRMAVSVRFGLTD